MKLSEAIAKGAEGHYQLRENFFDEQMDGTVLGCCALGAAALASCGGDHDHLPKDDEWVFADGLRKCGVEIPMEGKFQNPFYPKDPNERWGIPTLVVRLNDRYRWSFEEIINWLKGLGL